MKTLRLTLASLLWVPALLLVELPAILLAFVFVPLMLLFRQVRQEDESGFYYIKPHWIDAIWGNDEDGVAGPLIVTDNTSPSLRRWIERMVGKPLWYRVISWSCQRNPASNLRYARWWGLYLVRDEMEVLGNSDNPWDDYKRMIGIETDPTDRPTFVRDVFWCWARQGLKAGIWAIWPKRDNRFAILRLGWKVYPGYRRPIDRWVGFSVQAGWSRKADFA